MKFDELKDKTVAELATQSRELRQELFNLRLQKATAQLEKPSRLRILRKDIARVETRITQLRLQSAQPKVA
mgnify:CR=1 FL=1